MQTNDPQLEEWSRQSRETFRANNRIKSFDEFFESLKAAPYSLSRNAAQYLVDMMEFHGQEPAYVLGAPSRRFTLFDAPFPHASVQPLMGQEEPVLAVYEALRNFVMEGRSDRIIHLHGPNGSAKSLIVDLLMRGCEAYSATRDGMRYALSWVFPKGEEAVTMGFGSREREDGPAPGVREEGSFAHLPSGEIESHIPCEMNDSPILLFPKESRLSLLQGFLKSAPEFEQRRFVATHYLLEGDLCPKCRMIFDALIEEYKGDVSTLLRHVQVRRVYLSRSHRRGAVTISPQDTPDAASRQITADSSLQYLPRSLQHLNLVQFSGDLVDANNGLVEFSAFLTRAPELNKYLLAATERGELTLANANVSMNLVLFATSNERHLDAFKGTSDFASFKGRSILVTVPYLLEKRKERAVYGPILKRIGRTKHVAPHVGSLAALWAVLTRLNRPDPKRYPEPMASLVEGLSPLEKAALYDGTLPVSGDRYTPEELVALQGLLPLLREEFKDTPIFEGRFGASPRELREVLYNASLKRSEGCLTPAMVLAEMAAFIKDKSLYLFLQLKPEGGYHDAEKAVEWSGLEYLRTLEAEVLAAMGLLPKGGHVGLFARYASSLGNDGAIGKESEATKEVETLLGIHGKAEAFRKRTAGRRAAWEKEHPGDSLSVAELYSDLIANLAAAHRRREAKHIEEVGRAVLAAGSPAFKSFPADLQSAAAETLRTLIRKYGYCPACAPEAVEFYLGRAFAPTVPVKEKPVS